FSSDQLPRALEELATRFGCEAVILSTCNRVEMYLARMSSEINPDFKSAIEFLGESHGLEISQLQPTTYSYLDGEAVHHLFRVVASLDSLVLGEGQIAGQVKEAYESAQQVGAVGPVLHSLFQQARQVAKRVRTETGICHGKLSVSSLAIDYLTE